MFFDEFVALAVYSEQQVSGVGTMQLSLGDDERSLLTLEYKAQTLLHLLQVYRATVKRMFKHAEVCLTGSLRQLAL